MRRGGTLSTSEPRTAVLPVAIKNYHIVGAVSTSSPHKLHLQLILANNIKHILYQ